MHLYMPLSMHLTVCTICRIVDGVRGRGNLCTYFTLLYLPYSYEFERRLELPLSHLRPSTTVGRNGDIAARKVEQHNDLLHFYTSYTHKKIDKILSRPTLLITSMSLSEPIMTSNPFLVIGGVKEGSVSISCCCYYDIIYLLSNPSSISTTTSSPVRTLTQSWHPV